MVRVVRLARFIERPMDRCSLERNEAEKDNTACPKEEHGPLLRKDGADCQGFEPHAISEDEVRPRQSLS